jgi:hypothetical protein
MLAFSLHSHTDQTHIKSAKLQDSWTPYKLSLLFLLPQSLNCSPPDPAKPPRVSQCALTRIASNRRQRLHTLCLLDIKVKEPNLEALARGKTIYEPPR